MFNNLPNLGSAARKFAKWVDETDFLPGYNVAGGVRKANKGTLYSAVPKKTTSNKPASSPQKRTTDSPQAQTIFDPGAGDFFTGGGGGGGVNAAQAAQVAKDAAERDALRNELGGLGGNAEGLFADIFRRIEEVARGRRSKVDQTYNEQDAQYTKKYQEAIPQIDNAFAALGIGNSTYAGDRIDTATDEHKGALEKSKQNRHSDLAEVGNWMESQRGAFGADKANIMDAVNRSRGVENVSELRDARNNVSTTMNNIGGKRQALNDDGAAVSALNAKSNRSSNFDSAFKSLEGVLNSSMDVGTKSAAKDALVENANLTDDEKKKLSEVQVNNAYGRPATT